MNYNRVYYKSNLTKLLKFNYPSYLKHPKLPKTPQAT